MPDAAIYAVAGVVALALAGFLLIIMLPNRPLDPIGETNIGDIAASGLLKTVVLAM